MGEGESLLIPSGSASEVSNTLAVLSRVSCLDLDTLISIKHLRCHQYQKWFTLHTISLTCLMMTTRFNLKS